jgi:hypothetical protein
METSTTVGLHSVAFKLMGGRTKRRECKRWSIGFFIGYLAAFEEGFASLNWWEIEG